MAKSEEHDQIVKTLKDLADKQTSGKKLKYDPAKKMFVAVDSWDPSGDKLMDVTTRDLESFAAV